MRGLWEGGQRRANNEKHLLTKCEKFLFRHKLAQNISYGLYFLDTLAAVG